MLQQGEEDAGASARLGGGGAERELDVLEPALLLEVEFLVKEERAPSRVGGGAPGLADGGGGRRRTPRYGRGWPGKDGIFYFRCKDWDREELEL
jgi:hypothetical protein